MSEISKTRAALSARIADRPLASRAENDAVGFLLASLSAVEAQPFFPPARTRLADALARYEAAIHPTLAATPTISTVSVEQNPRE